MNRRLAAALLSIPLLAGCAGQQRERYQTGIREPISLRDEGDECGATLVQTYVGLRANDTVREEVTRRSGAATIRWVAPGEAVTLDFRPDRLTAELDQDGVVTTLRCG